MPGADVEAVVALALLPGRSAEILEVAGCSGVARIAARATAGEVLVIADDFTRPQLRS